MPAQNVSTIYIGLGSNMGDREGHLRRALSLLAERIGPLTACSTFVETDPVGFSSPNKFLNAAAAFSTTLTADALLAETQQIERELGRTHKSHDGVYADRPIDIDLLLSTAETCDRPELTLPHPRLTERRFVLQPLCEIAPFEQMPDGRFLIDILLDLDGISIEEMAESSDGIAHFIEKILPQLTENTGAFDANNLKALAADASTHLYLARDVEGRLCGMATLCLTLAPTGCRGWVEDVVVDEAHRGKGIGAALLTRIEWHARRLGAKSLNLTSRPEREAANRLYRSLGFETRRTNVYRKKL